MKRHKWSSEQKLKIVLEGLSGPHQNKKPRIHRVYEVSSKSFYGGDLKCKCWFFLMHEMSK